MKIIDEDINEISSERSVTIKELLESRDNSEHGWHYKNLLEELIDWNPQDDVYGNITVKEMREGLVGDEAKDIKEGDIIFANKFDSSVTGSQADHRIIVVNKINKQDGVSDEYLGYEIQTSKGQPENWTGIYNQDDPKKWNNVYIDSYRSILDRSPKNASLNKPLYLVADKLIKFKEDDLEKSGYWKGHINNSFKEFMINTVKDAAINPELNKTKKFPEE